MRTHFVSAALVAAAGLHAAQGFSAGKGLRRAAVRMATPLGDQYCVDQYRTTRRKTRTVEAGPVKIGSEHPITLQTMTNTNTKDVMATVDQVMRCKDLGADLVRLTVQGKKEAEACMHIRETLFKKGYDVPLVADIHFQPKVAMMVAECFEKIRVNPGNFADGTKSFEETVYETQEEYNAERGHIEELFIPLVEKCKSLNRAIRIGTNHGSLSARVMSFYGDTPEGMVESAIEFADICREQDYHNFLFSMKASNPVVMVSAYRRLAARMYDLDWDYPLHLGVTEAGEGEDGRMKSAIGIGTLLSDGLGDTIRVSLTEDPELELAPCGELARLGRVAASPEVEKLYINVPDYKETKRDFANFERRKGAPLEKAEGETFPTDQYLHQDGSVFSVISSEMLETPDVLYQQMGAKIALGMPFKDIATSDSLILKDVPAADNKDARLALKRLQEVGVGVIADHADLAAAPIPEAVAKVTLSELVAAGGAASFLEKAEAKRVAVVVDGSEEDAAFDALKAAEADVLCVILKVSDDLSRVHASRRVFELLHQKGVSSQVMHYLVAANGEGVLGRENFVLKAGSQAGALLVDGLGDGVVIENGNVNDDITYPLAYLRETAFGMLQGTRIRTVKTEFVSCPSCGRTLFDLQEVTDQIRLRTGHLPGVSIAIMGCIVNGPGEMADADFGYVGSAAGKIDLYVGKEVVQRGIKMDTAPDALVELIKEHGKWKDPEEADAIEEAPVAA
eukprot:CAMPEP_0118853360 /NCGR_PEP_ID=MMETSP1163-20130328/1976_1 /TAXON_ID=124430 /ORGANISM="Phaeomonas parva, Strain CCMP2877" /LENGTH=735 /DNA_ID=CAMNT_0006785903 /DNA_START=126 /DNA_END=2333 /DNA_ORIENTATION=+